MRKHRVPNQPRRILCRNTHRGRGWMTIIGPLYWQDGRWFEGGSPIPETRECPGPRGQEAIRDEMVRLAVFSPMRLPPDMEQRTQAFTLDGRRRRRGRR